MDVQVILMQMIQLFLVMALGYILYTIKLLDKEMNKRLTSLILSVTTPAMIIGSVLNTTVSQSLNNVLFVFIVGLATYIILPIIGFIIVKMMRIPKQQQGLYIFMTVFSNIGFMGFPVMKAIFGNSAVFYTAIFNMIFNLFVFTVGNMMMSYGTGRKTHMNMKNVLSPGVIASLIALLIYFTKLQVPDIIASTVNMIGDITTPIAMMIIGSTLATIPIKEVFTEIRIYPYTFIKQVIVPIAIYPLLKLVIADPLILGVTLIMLAMPVGNSAVLFATEYGGDVSVAAKNIFMTTLFSILTIPLIVALFLV